MIDSFFGAFIFIKHTIAKKAVFGQSFLLLLSAPLEVFGKRERLINGASDLAGTAGTVNNYVTIHFGNENALQTYNYLL